MIAVVVVVFVASAQVFPVLHQELFRVFRVTAELSRANCFINGALHWLMFSVLWSQAFTTPQAQPHVGLGSHERRCVSCSDKHAFITSECGIAWCLVGSKISDWKACRFELLPNSCALSLLSKGSKKKFGAVELGLHKRRPSDNDEKNDGMTLWDHFKAEFKFSEQVQSYFINLVTVSLGAYIALLLLSDAVKFRQMGLGML